LFPYSGIAVIFVIDLRLVPSGHLAVDDDKNLRTSGLLIIYISNGDLPI
jgi:hypothetical protein